LQFVDGVGHFTPLECPRDLAAALLEAAFGEESMGEWRLIRADCNRMPAAISYVRRPWRQ
jgi:hypothetical protein